MPQSKATTFAQALRQRGWLGTITAYLKALGPGLITGASDDDPSGIGTYAQTGAQFGYAQLWTALVTFPLMAAVQEMCARLALHTGRGLADIIREHYPKPILYVCVLLLVTANTINLGTDLGAMAASCQMLLTLPFGVWLLAFTLLTVVLEIFVRYTHYARVLRWLTFSLCAYVLVAFVVAQDWRQVLRSTFIPTFQFNHEYLLNLVAVLGTTISPYLFFWQASQEVEEDIDAGKTTLAARQGVSTAELRWMRTDVTSGMLFSNLVMWFIIVTAAATLFRHGITDIDSAPKAAEALRPIAGRFASVLFAAGIVGTGLLAVPILAGSAAYAVAETFTWREGLYRRLRQAPGFYGVIAFATGLGAAINVVGINPIKALYYTAVLNGLVAPPLLWIILLMSNNRTIMQENVNGRMANLLGWVTTIVMTMAAGALLVTFSAGR
jgi:NRAMP (natural resistance-associated macrophage protein)-like metal ion transporter